MEVLRLINIIVIIWLQIAKIILVCRHEARADAGDITVGNLICSGLS